MGRAPCCDKANVKKGPWSPEEDSKLKEYIEKYGTGGNWIALPQKAGLKRCGKSCRLRWLNYLRPNIKHGEFSDDEDRIICSLFASIGSRWSIIAAQLPGRTDNDIKNYWNTKLKKKLMGFMPSSSHRKPPQPQFLQTHPSSNRFSYYVPSRSFETMSSSTFINNTSLFQSSEESLMASMQPYHPVVKDDLYIMFGGEPSSTTSDNSSNQIISYGKEQEELPLENYFYNAAEEKYLGVSGSGWSSDERSSCLWGEAQPQPTTYEDSNNSSISDHNNFFFNESKTQGKVMYY
ncbi:hypothetical protein ACHQM5_030056 [Ranunculus cassubicifolius]